MAQALATIITLVVFGGTAYGLDALFTMMGSGT